MELNKILIISKFTGYSVLITKETHLLLINYTEYNPSQHFHQTKIGECIDISDFIKKPIQSMSQEQILTEVTQLETISVTLHKDIPYTIIKGKAV